MSGLHKIPKIQILLSTYNGEKYLEEQLESIVAQQGVEVTLFIRDDGSTDATTHILNEFKTQYPDTRIVFGRNIGWRASFMYLLMNSNPDIDYYAFSDQDDVWCPNKLKEAIRHISNETVPFLYQSIGMLVDENLNQLTDYKVYEEPQNRNDAMLNSWAQGCTMVFNNIARKYAASVVPNQNAAHDMWVYLICYFFGGIYFDKSHSYIKYRQHGDNATEGAADGHCVWNISFVKKQIEKFIKNDFYSNYGQDIYVGFSESLNSDDKIALMDWAYYKRNLRAKIRLICSKTVRKRTLLGTIGLKSAILLSKF